MKKRESRFYKLLGGLLALSLVAAGCGGGANTAGTANTPAGNAEAKPAEGTAQAAVDENATVSFATPADPNFNPWSPTGYMESMVLTQIIFDGLTKWGTDYTPIPSLAESWTTSGDGKTWTFKLRDGVKWQDGQPFSADDVVYTFNEIVLNKDLGANGSANFNALDKVVAKSPNEVQFLLKEPWSSLPNYLAYYAKILPKHIFAGQDPWKLTSFNKEKPIGTGPFKVVKYSPGQAVELERNPDYFGGAAKIAKVIVHIVPDTNTQIAQLLSGTLSLVNVKDPNLLERLKQDQNLNIAPVTENTYYWVALDQSQERFRDAKVRQALLYAIDRESIIKGVLKGYGEVATGPIPPLQSKYYTDDVQKYSFDPEKAKALLQEAGYTPGADGFMQKDGKTLELSMPTGQFGVLVPATQLVQQYWQKIGVKVNLEVMDWNSYVQKVVVNRKYDATLCWWAMPTDPDVLTYYSSATAGKGYNIPGYKNPQLDALLTEGRKTADPEQRVKTYQEAQKMMATELPYLYLWYPQAVIAANKKLTMPNTSFSVAEDHINEWTVTK